MDKTNKNIDEMLLCVKSNNIAIADMLTAAKTDSGKISGEMKQYADKRTCLNKEQMTAYAEYARAFDSVKKLYGNARDMTTIENIYALYDPEAAYSLLDDMNTRQLGIIEQLKSVVEKAKAALKLLCMEKENA